MTQETKANDIKPLRTEDDGMVLGLKSVTDLIKEYYADGYTKKSIRVALHSAFHKEGSRFEIPVQGALETLRVAKLVISKNGGIDLESVVRLNTLILPHYISLPEGYSVSYIPTIQGGSISFDPDTSELVFKDSNDNLIKTEFVSPAMKENPIDFVKEISKFFKGYLKDKGKCDMPIVIVHESTGIFFGRKVSVKSPRATIKNAGHYVKFVQSIPYATEEEANVASSRRKAFFEAKRNAPYKDRKEYVSYGWAFFAQNKPSFSEAHIVNNSEEQWSPIEGSCDESRHFSGIHKWVFNHFVYRMLLNSDPLLTEQAITWIMDNLRAGNPNTEDNPSEESADFVIEVDATGKILTQFNILVESQTSKEIFRNSFFPRSYLETPSRGKVLFGVMEINGQWFETIELPVQVRLKPQTGEISPCWIEEVAA